MTETPERGPDGNPVVRTIRRGFYEYMDTGFRLYSRFWGKNRQPDSWTLTWEYKQVDSVGSVDPVLGTLFGVNPVITDAPRRVIEAERSNT